MALYGEGYGLEPPVVARGLAALGEHWGYERDGGTHIQASEFAGLGHDDLPARPWSRRATTLQDTPAMRRALAISSTHRSGGRRLVADTSKTSRPAAGRSSAPISATPMSTTPPSALLVLAKLRDGERRSARARRCRDRAGARNGCSACKAPTAAGAHSTATMTRRSSPKSPSAISARRSIRPASTSPPMCSRHSAALGMRQSHPQSPARWPSLCASRSRRARGSAAGASTTSTASAPCCRRSRAIGEDMSAPRDPESRRLAGRQAERRRRLGRKLRVLYGRRLDRPRRRARPRKPPGR